MKFSVTKEIIKDLGNLRGRRLLRGKYILVIRDFQYIVEKVEPEPVAQNTSVFKRKKFKKQEPTEIIYLTSLKIEGYNNNLKFVGTYNEEYCIQLLAEHMQAHYTLNLFSLAAAWEYLNDQIIALGKHEAELAQDKEERELREVIDLLLADKPINAIKKYKEITGASLVDSRDYVKNILQPKYCVV